MELAPEEKVWDLDCDSLNSFEAATERYMLSNNNIHQCGTLLQFVKRNMISMPWVCFL
jgi:hypothetical protein